MTKAKQMRLGTAALRAAQVVIPKSQREETFNYLKEYNCLPPPIFLVIITIVEVYNKLNVIHMEKQCSHQTWESLGIIFQIYQKYLNDF